MSTNKYIFIEKNIPVETLLTDFFKSNNKYKTIHPIQIHSDDQEIVVKWGDDCATIMDISKRDDYIESNIHPNKVFVYKRDIGFYIHNWCSVETDLLIVEIFNYLLEHTNCDLMYMFEFDVSYAWRENGALILNRDCGGWDSEKLSLIKQPYTFSDADY